MVVSEEVSGGLSYWAVDPDYAFPIHSLFVDIQRADGAEELGRVTKRFRDEAMKLREFGAERARLMSDLIDVTLPVEKLTENKLDTFIISIVRSERKGVPIAAEEPSKLKSFVKKLFRR